MTTAPKQTRKKPSVPLEPRTWDSTILTRILSEGYGDGSWHGPDLKAALADVTAATAFWRPDAKRHNIAELALHHTWFVRSVWQQLTGRTAEPFVLGGEDWFELNDGAKLSWARVTEVVAAQQRALEKAAADIAAGRITPPDDAKPFDLVLGITCHAVYHAGQIQLLKRLKAR